LSAFPGEPRHSLLRQTKNGAAGRRLFYFGNHSCGDGHPVRDGVLRSRRRVCRQPRAGGDVRSVTCDIGPDGVTARALTLEAWPAGAPAFFFWTAGRRDSREHPAAVPGLMSQPGAFRTESTATGWGCSGDRESPERSDGLIRPPAATCSRKLVGAKAPCGPASTRGEGIEAEPAHGCEHEGMEGQPRASRTIALGRCLTA
jgi:hypothetical protein